MPAQRGVDDVRGEEMIRRSFPATDAPYGSRRRAQPRLRACRWCALLALSIVLLHGIGFAQSGDSSSTPSPISLHGSITLSPDFYGSTATPDSAQPARRPARLHRLLINATLGFGDVMAIPMTLLLSAPEVSTTTSALPNPTLAQFLENPANVLGGQAADRGGYLPSQQLKADGRFPNTDPDDHWWTPAGRPATPPASAPLHFRLA